MYLPKMAKFWPLAYAPVRSLNEDEREGDHPVRDYQTSKKDSDRQRAGGGSVPTHAATVAAPAFSQ
jgi:hypothetical protein